MNRSVQSIILAFSGLALLLAVAAAVFDQRLALGAAAIAGCCAVWAALMAGVNRDSSRRACPEMRATPNPALVARAERPVPADSSQRPVVEPVPSAEFAASVPPTRSVARAETPLGAENLAIPLSVEPGAVLSALFANARLAGVPAAAHLWLEDIGTPTLRLVSTEGPVWVDHTPLPVDEGVFGRAMASGVARCERLIDPSDSEAEEPGWRYALPLSTDEVSGVVAVDFKGSAEPDFVQLTRVSSALRSLLIGSLTLHVARSEASSARQLLETASDMSRLLDSDAVVSSALKHALRLSGAETGSVMLLDDEGVRMRIAEAHGLPDDVVGQTRVSEGEGIAGWVLASGRPLLVEDLENKGPQSRRHGVLSAASVPISDDDGVLGVLNIGSRRFHARFSRSHVRALEAVGRITAIALRNAHAVAVTQDLFFDTLKALALALETRDPYTRGGTARILYIAVSLGDAMGLGEDEAYALKLAALVHDIGMSAAGDSVAVTDRPLTTVEWGILKMHPQIAAEILSQAPALSAAIPIVFHHHEHYDGRGYGSGLAGDGIPRGARILSVADAFVAMTSTRPYRSALTPELAMHELTSCAGTQFDPLVVEAMVGLMSSDAECFAVKVR